MRSEGEMYVGDNEQEIRELIHRWAAAVHAGDLEVVLADHTEDIVMFDVPPPNEGVRGIDAYRETWPPFFEWQRSGASFEIVSLDVAAGEDVAFAWAGVGPARRSPHPPSRSSRRDSGPKKRR
jgi:ketosteroid isomerase-like protein